MLYRIRRPTQHDQGLDAWLVWYNDEKVKLGPKVAYVLVPQPTRSRWRKILLPRRPTKYYHVPSGNRIQRLEDHFWLAGYVGWL